MRNGISDVVLYWNELPEDAEASPPETETELSR